MKNECNIIRDILPLYVEDIVSADTSAFVEEHLEKCAECRAELENMKKPNEIEKSTPSIQDNDTIQLKAFKRKWNKKKRLMIGGTVVVTVMVILVTVMVLWSPVIFQRGNPVPYLVAATKISEETPYVQVNVDGGSSIYISKNGECPELFEYVESSRNVELIEQAGGGYIFSNGVDSLIISSEVYWGKYMVWQVPNKTLADRTDIEVESIDYPPMVMFNNILYTATSYSGDKEDLSVVGKIESYIDYGVPAENNQANDPLVGCEIYTTSSAPDFIFVLNNGVYSPYKSTDGTGI